MRCLSSRESEAVGVAHRYRVVFQEPASGAVEEAIFTVTDEEWPVATSTSMVWDRDLFSDWPGDAASRGEIFDQVRDFHTRATRK